MPCPRFLLSFLVLAGMAVASAGAATLTTRVVDPAGAALSDAVVYVVPVAGKAPLRSAPTAIIDQVGKQFTPLVSVVQTGTSVSFPNKDNIRHQVYSFSTPKTFELKLYSGVPSQPIVFDKPGLVVMGCNIHDQMVAYVQIVDTPWFAKTGPDGVSHIDDLPAGDYLVYAWHYRMAEQPAFVLPTRLAADATIKVTLAVKPRS